MFVAQKLEEFGLKKLGEQLSELVKKLHIELKVFKSNDMILNDVFDELVSDLQVISRVKTPVSEITRNNLIRMNDEYLDYVICSLNQSYSCNTIMVDDTSLQLFLSCLIVYQFRKIRQKVKLCIEHGEQELD